MDRNTLLLSATLCILSLGVVVLSLDLLTGARRKAAAAAPPQDDLRVFLQLAPPMPVQSGQAEQVIALETPPLPEDFVFRRRVSRDFASMEISHKRFRASETAGTEVATEMDMSAIRHEVRAALGTATPGAPPVKARLRWTDTDRMAVLSLAGAAPASGLALLKRHGIGTLIAAPGHPFKPEEEAIEILPLPDGSGTAAPLAARLRAKLARGERIAFHTETGLSGPAALLAARFASRQAG
ncbi:MAG: hypothetical protein KGQ79_09470 [Proteobacteria bacterium]|nr:hypothetical protein [Pseudomonadota bacterium]MBU6424841.1 hypothetical protein [Rhodospirillales bacterium]